VRIASGILETFEIGVLDDVDLAGFECEVSRCAVGNDTIDDPLRSRQSRAEERRICLQADVITADPVHEFEGSRADRMLTGTGSAICPERHWTRESECRDCQVRQERAVWAVEHQLQGVRIERPSFLERRSHEGIPEDKRGSRRPRGIVLVGPSVDVHFCGRRVPGRSILEGDAVAQRERPDKTIWGD